MYVADWRLALEPDSNACFLAKRSTRNIGRASGPEDAQLIRPTKNYQPQASFTKKHALQSQYKLIAYHGKTNPSPSKPELMRLVPALFVVTLLFGQLLAIYTGDH